MRLSEYPHPSRMLLHISDTHFVPAGELLYGAADEVEHLRRLLERFVATGLVPDALIFTGDLADRGEPAAYELLKAEVEPVASELGAEVIWVMGNHDDRASMRTSLLGRPASDEPHDEVHWIGGLRIVVLDSTVPGEGHGELTDDQLAWLSAELAAPAAEGTTLALHHPPVPCVQDLAVTVELRDQHRLATALKGSDVRAIIGGHLHYSTFATFAGIPVSVAAATCYTQDLFMPGRGTRGRDAAQAINLIGLYEHTVLHTIMPIHSGLGVGREVDGERTAAMLAEAGLAIRP